MSSIWSMACLIRVPALVVQQVAEADQRIHRIIVVLAAARVHLLYVRALQAEGQLRALCAIPCQQRQGQASRTIACQLSSEAPDSRTITAPEPTIGKAEASQETPAGSPP